MTANDKIKAIGVQERFRDIRPELHPAAALAGCTARLLLGVTPEDVTHDA